MPEPIDAADISGDDILLRRIDPKMIDRNPDGSESIQSWAFRDQNRELSVYLARETTVAAVLQLGTPGQVIIGIRAEDIRKLGYRVVRDPEASNSAHCLIHPHPRRKDEKKMSCASVRVEVDPPV